MHLQTFIERGSSKCLAALYLYVIDTRKLIWENLKLYCYYKRVSDVKLSFLFCCFSELHILYASKEISILKKMYLRKKLFRTELFVLFYFSCIVTCTIGIGQLALVPRYLYKTNMPQCKSTETSAYCLLMQMKSLIPFLGSLVHGRIAGVFWIVPHYDYHLLTLLFA